MVSFDVSCNDRLIAAGTEHTGGDAFILFWDIRYGKSMKKKINNKIVGGYWESHTDDITCLSFNPVKSNFLASGSTDGLINVFDLTQPSEDEALMYSLNTESSVVRELFHTYSLHKLTEVVSINSVFRTSWVGQAMTLCGV